MWRPLKTLEKEGLIEVTSLPCQPDGTLILEKLPPAIRPNTRLIVLTHASNVTGTLMPVAEISRIARKAEIPVLLDAAQTAGVYPLDVAELGIHLLAFTGHKGLLGPQGTGGLYISPEINLKPLKEGGTGSESLPEYQPDTVPDRFEAGTLNVAGIAGLGAAVSYTWEVGIENIRQKEKLLTKQLLDGLASNAGLKVYGPCDPDWQVGVVSFNFEAIAPEEVAYALDEMYGIMVRAGLHCAPCAHRTIGTIATGTVRASIGYFNHQQDIECLLEALKSIADKLYVNSPARRELPQEVRTPPWAKS